jgi:hypothetical protein
MAAIHESPSHFGHLRLWHQYDACITEGRSTYVFEFCGTEKNAKTELPEHIFNACHQYGLYFKAIPFNVGALQYVPELALEMTLKAARTYARFNVGEVLCPLYGDARDILSAKYAASNNPGPISVDMISKLVVDQFYDTARVRLISMSAARRAFDNFEWRLTNNTISKKDLLRLRTFANQGTASLNNVRGVFSASYAVENARVQCGFFFLVDSAIGTRERRHLAALPVPYAHAIDCIYMLAEYLHLNILAVGVNVPPAQFAVPYRSTREWGVIHQHILKRCAQFDGKTVLPRRLCMINEDVAIFDYIVSLFHCNDHTIDLDPALSNFSTAAENIMASLVMQQLIDPYARRLLPLSSIIARFKFVREKPEGPFLAPDVLAIGNSERMEGPLEIARVVAFVLRCRKFDRVEPGNFAFVYDFDMTERDVGFWNKDGVEDYEACFRALRDFCSILAAHAPAYEPTIVIVRPLKPYKSRDSSEIEVLSEGPSTSRSRRAPRCRRNRCRFKRFKRLATVIESDSSD